MSGEAEEPGETQPASARETAQAPAVASAAVSVALAAFETIVRSGAFIRGSPRK